METADIQRSLQAIDASVKGLWNEVVNLNNRISDCESQIVHCQYMANMILGNMSEEDEYSLKVAEAQSYINQAENLQIEIAEYENRIVSAKNELRGYISQYDCYRRECESNIQNLNIVVQKLLATSNSKYSVGVSNALNSAKQKLVQNKKYCEGCISRMNTIQQLCGSDGESKQKVLKK